VQVDYRLFTSVAAAVAVLTLTGCGGGGDAPAASAPTTTTPPPAPAITVQGTAPAVTADPLAVVFVPQTETSTRSTQQSIASNAFPAQFQKATAEGAYQQLGIDGNSLITLSGGKIVDVAGNGDFAIGRWTDGSNSIGSISANQGAHYAVGRPLSLTPNLDPAVPDTQATCTLTAATSPTAVSGNFAPGKVNSATATLSLKFARINTLTLDVSVGADQHATATIPFPTSAGVLQSSGVMQHVQFFGSSATNPSFAFGYAMPTPTSGDVTGVVVLQCKQPS